MKYLNAVKFTSYLYCCLFLFSEILFSQENQDDFTFINVKEYISQRPVTSIIQDHQGYIWMGSHGDGLSKFNGIDFINYKQDWNKDNTINSSRIYCIYLDSNNQMWVGTNEGLNLYDRELDQFIEIPLNTSSTKTQIPVHAIIENNNKELLIGTHEYGLFKLNMKDYSLKKIPFTGTEQEENLQINVIQKTPRGSMLVGSNFGLMLHNTTEQKLELAKFETLKGAESITSPIESILLSENENIWLGTSSEGLLEISTTPTNHYQFTKHNITDKRILSIAKSSKGTLYCGTENDGLFVLNKEGELLKNYRYDKLNKKGVKSNSIWSVFIDRQDRIWLGYYINGVDVYDKKVIKFRQIESLPNNSKSLYSSSVTGISKDKTGKFWIGMIDGGVDVYDPEINKMTHLYNTKNPIAKGLTSSDVQTLFIDSKENVWVGTWSSGIYLLKKNTKIFQNISIENSNNVLLSNRIMSFSEDSKGVIWIGTFSGGLYSYDLQLKTFKHCNTKSFRESSLDYGNIRKVLVDSQDNIWAGTLTSLFKITPIDKTSFNIVSMTDEMDKSSKKKGGYMSVLSILEDSNKNIWIGTESHGLFKYVPSKDSFSWFNKKKNLVHQSVNSIVEAENGHIWISGNKGLSELDIENNSFIDFTSKDGLLSNNFNNNAVFKDQNGILYFGNYKGINYFNPKEIEINQDKPVVYLSNLKLFYKKVLPDKPNSPLSKVISETENLTLKYNQSVFTIEYIGINYTRSENNQYAYYLEGFDGSWNFVGNNRSATYTNIPAGNYVFKVKSANNDGVWNETPTELHIRVLPPWWRSTIAEFLYILFFLIIIYLIFRFLNERIKEKRTLAFEREDRRQKEVLNAKKIQFFTNISHEFRTPLTLILNPLEDIIENTSIGLPNEIRKKHATIHKNAKRLSRLINELMDFRKLQFNKMTVKASEIEVNSFLSRVISYFEEEADQRNIILSVDSEETSHHIWADSSMLEKIIFNILSNAFKATPNNGMVKVHVHNTTQVLLPLVDEINPVSAIEISIEDTGHGIRKEEIDKIFERFYQAKEMDKQYYGGTGIGLEVVRSFVDLHKGKIEVESTQNIGTQFKIYLPLGNSHFQQSELIIAKATSTEENEQLEVGHKKVLLIVEDNTELRTYLKDELSDRYKILEAENGKEGFEKAKKTIPDIIITDVMMPIMDGYALCSNIKQNLKTSHIPLLMLTAKGMESDRVKGIDSGADVYMNKPFNMKTLRSHLKQLIRGRQILFNKYFNGISENNITESTTSLDKEFIGKVLNYIHENISNSNLNVENLAEELFLSRSKLYRKIKALTGCTASEFLRKIRLEKGKQLIETTEDTISEICYNVGFSSPSYFTKCFKNHFKILPTEIRPIQNEKEKPD